MKKRDWFDHGFTIRLSAARGVFAFLAMWLGCQRATSAVTVSVSPAALAWDSNAWVSVSVSNTAAGSSSRLLLFADVDRNGAIGAKDRLLARFDVSDGVTNTWDYRTVVDDRDATSNGIVQARISYFGNDLNWPKAIGSYVWAAVNAGSTAAAPFSVTQPAGAVSVAGVVRDAGTSNVVGGAIVVMEFFNEALSHMVLAMTDTNGAFSMFLPPQASTDDVRSVTATAPGYLMAERDETGTPLSTYTFTNSLSPGLNVVPRPLVVVPAIPGRVYSVSGRVLDEGGSGLQGVQVWFDSDDADVFGWAVTDASGAYSIPVPGGVGGEILTASPWLTMRGLLAEGTWVEPMGNETGVDLTAWIPTAFLYGRMTNSVGAGVAGVGLEIGDDYNGSFVFSYTNGFYECFLPVSFGVEGEVDVFSALPMGYAAASGLYFDEVADGTRTNVDVALYEGFPITGRVTGPGGQPLSGGRVSAWANDWGWDPSGEGAANLSGRYSLLATAGTYRVEARDFPGYVSMVYSNHYTWEWDNGSVYDPVTLTAGGRSNINFNLPAAARIAGRITGGGLPLEGSRVEVAERHDHSDWYSWDFRGSANTDPDGRYSIEVPEGTNYFVRAEAPDGTYWVPTYYDGVYRLDDASPIATALASPATNIDVTLPPGFRIEGFVTDTNGDGFSWVNVGALQVGPDQSTEWVAEAYTESDGAFAMNLPPGTGYVLRTYLWGVPYPDMYFSNVYTLGQATLLQGTGGTVQSNCDFVLRDGCIITGFVFQSDGVTPFGFGSVRALDAQTNETAMTGTDGDGSYRLIVPAGLAQRLQGDGGPDSVQEFYSNTYDFAEAVVLNPVALSTSRIDFVLYNTFQDVDGDGLADWREDSRPDGAYNPAQDASNRQAWDTDGDGFSDGQEVNVTQTNPRDAADRLAMRPFPSAGPGQITVEWTSVPGVFYRIWRSYNLMNTNAWDNFENATGTNTTTRVTDNPASNAVYRVEAVP